MACLNNFDEDYPGLCIIPGILPPCLLNGVAYGNVRGLASLHYGDLRGRSLLLFLANPPLTSS